MKKDPPVRPDCAACGKPRHPERAHTKAARAEAALDPFCCSPCARAWHGCPIMPAPTGTSAARAGMTHKNKGGVRVGATGCGRCGGPFGEETPGCRACRRRHANRRVKDELVAAEVVEREAVVA